MNNPLLYPFLAIVGVLTLAFAVWCYFTIKERRRRVDHVKRYVTLQEADEAFQRALVRASMVAAAVAVPVSEPVRAAKLKLNSLYGKFASSAPMYRHHGHRHAKRPPNRADRRAAGDRIPAGNGGRDFMGYDESERES